MKYCLKSNDSSRMLGRNGSVPARNKSYKTSNGGYTALGFLYFPMPEDITLITSDSYSEVLGCIEQIRRECASKRVFLDFTKVKDISASALVYLLGEIHRISKDFGRKRIRVGKSGAVRKITNVLNEMDFLSEHVGVTKSSGLVLCHGNGKPGDLLDNIMDGISDAFESGFTPEQENLVYRAISEAILNVNYHAYGVETDKPWWLLTKVFSGRLYLALYDTGYGIPETIPRRVFFDRLRQIVNINFDSDASLIAGAMEASRTSTGEEKHGKGSLDIKALVDADSAGTQESHLLIHSKKGCFQHSKRTPDILEDLSRPVNGTLLQWVIPLK